MFLTNIFIVTLLGLVNGAAVLSQAPSDLTISSDLPEIDTGVRLPVNLTTINSLTNTLSKTTSMDLIDGADARAWYYRCDTTEGSPIIDPDLIQLSIKFQNYHPEWECTQLNAVKSKCTKLNSYGSAAVSICGTLGHQANCRAIGFWTWYIVMQCRGKGKGAGRAGGVLWIDGGNRLVWH
ncbi:hypothetical protein EDC01DRAFT_779974 [Geopyxis carbonaria]|nr:hypothetical protein EDC01DRAFT_779974 [Geopyxis carbonaria]